MGARLRTEQRELPCPLTHDELIAKGDALANVLRRLDAEREAMEQAKAESKERTADLVREQSKLRQEIQERREFRPIDVEVYVKSGAVNMVEEIRVDTGEVIRERFMDDEERQMRLPN